MRDKTKIRITEREIKAIKELAVEVFGEGTRLFFSSLCAIILEKIQRR